MVVHLHRQMQFYMLNYVDDFLGIEYRSQIFEAHAAFIRLLENIGIKRSIKKSIPPAQVIEFVGNLVDTINMTLGVMPCELEMW